MKARIVIILAALLLLCLSLDAPRAHGQDIDGSIHVKSFPGKTVGEKITNAQTACSGVLPCVLVLDPSLASFPVGVFPTPCALCTMADFRQGASGVASTGVAMVSNLQGYTASEAAILRRITVQSYGGTAANLGGGTFVWLTGANTPDGCMNFAAVDDPTGSTGVWQRLGSYALVLTPELCGAVGDGITNDNAAMQRLVALLAADVRADHYTTVQLSSRATYKITAALPMPVGDVNGLHGDDWAIMSSGGKATILQATDNTPIFLFTPPAGGRSRRWRILGIHFKWSNDQTAAQTNAIAIKIDPQGTDKAGMNQFEIGNCDFDNGWGGIVISQASTDAGFAFPTWGFSVHDITAESNKMAGTIIRMGSWNAAGATRGNFWNVYLQTGNVTGGVPVILNQLDQGNGEFEFNLGTDTQLLVAGCDNLRLQLRDENSHQTFNGSKLFSFNSTTNIHIESIKVKSHHIDVAANNAVYYISAYKARVMVEDSDFDTDFTNGGQAIVAYPDGPDSSQLGRITFSSNMVFAGTTATYLYNDGPILNNSDHVTFARADSFLFAGNSLAANATTVLATGSVGVGGVIAPKDGYVTRVDVAVSSAVTAGSAGYFVCVNGTCASGGPTGSLLVGDTIGTRTGTPYVGVHLAAGLPFKAKDILTIKVVTTSAFAPAGAGQNVTGELTVMYQ